MTNARKPYPLSQASFRCPADEKLLDLQNADQEQQSVQTQAGPQDNRYEQDYNEKSNKEQPDGTKQLIRSAFITLYRQKPIEQITVRELIQAAHVSRGAFYYYYADMFALRDSLTEELIQSVCLFLDAIIPEMIHNNLQFDTQAVKAFMFENKEIIGLFFRDRPDPALFQTLKNCAKHRALAGFGLNPETLTQSQDYAVNYIADAQINLWQRWIANDMDVPLEDIVPIMEKAVKHVMMGFLLEPADYIDIST